MHSHRAPRDPIAEKGRYAVAAALVAGVGVTGVAAASDGAGPASAVARANSQATMIPSPGITPSPAATPSSGVAQSTSVAPLPAAGVAPGGQPYVAQRRKVKPLPQWVNPMPEGSVTSCFGQRWGRLHAGVDLAAPMGTPIRAAGKGVVVSAGAAEGYGNAVLIDHGNGYLTHYGHMSVITATAGQRVEAGDQIGEEGSTGHSTGPHLHFEVHQGSYQNPIEPTQWMHEHGVDIASCATFTN
ncbi:peptidoglycan DD-metalloendopeptidase family protein [Actinoplanes sp. NPDC051346]|uniref:M23 family metallopeptidase n=1 Tax=Actinoplanes sp. NPDC051346 TaxID=3155048 RepID=UPI003442388D